MPSWGVCPSICIVSKNFETAKDTAIVAFFATRMENRTKVSNGTIFSDLHRLSEIFTATKHRTLLVIARQHTGARYWYSNCLSVRGRPSVYP